ncbi:hypothetical protein D3C86_1774060 [compost metagenome]
MAKGDEAISLPLALPRRAFVAKAGPLQQAGGGEVGLFHHRQQPMQRCGAVSQREPQSQRRAHHPLAPMLGIEPVAQLGSPVSRVGIVVADGAERLARVLVANEVPGTATRAGQLGVPIHLGLACRQAVIADAVAGDDSRIGEAAIDVGQVGLGDGIQPDLWRCS